MTAEEKNKLEKTVADVLERFTFMFTEMPDEAVEAWSGESLYATITFEGDVSGALCITAPDVLCREIAANVLGVTDPDDITPETGEDALKELLNIICGELVAELYGTRAVFDLTVPSLSRIDRSKWRELAADGENIRVLVDEYPLLVSLVTGP